MVKTTLATKSVTLAVTRLATGYLKEAAAACARLADPGDGEALHDFRVALRRLRSLLRAYRPWLGGALPRKRIRKIGKLARRTGAARDAEVQLAWLRAQQAAVNDSERPGVQWLLDHLNARRDPEYRRLRDELPTAFARLRKRLAVRLSALGDEAAPPLGMAVAQRLRETAADFQAHLEKVHGAAAEDEIHPARIAGKRLRYLLEPLAGELGNGKELVKELRRLQDLMGEIHDYQVLGAELLQAAELAGAARLHGLVEAGLQRAADPRGSRAAGVGEETDGLVRIGYLLHQARQDRTARLLERIEAGEVDRFLDHLHGVCDRLQETAVTP
ncbi:MAG: CHAD domain-containing protein [Gammaproteobacteria bacterium]